MKRVIKSTSWEYECPSCGNTQHTTNHPLMNREQECPYCSYNGYAPLHQFKQYTTVNIQCSRCGGDYSGYDENGNWRSTQWRCKRCNDVV